MGDSAIDNGGLLVSGSPAYLRSVMAALISAHGDIPLLFLLAASPSPGRLTFRERRSPAAGDQEDMTIQ